jgi:hypothetical protein
MPDTKGFHLNWHGIGAFLLTALGVATSPAVTGLLPAKVAVPLAAAGAVYAALSKPAVAPTS